jgi:S-adenosylmethionine decarboxylase
MRGKDEKTVELPREGIGYHTLFDFYDCHAAVLNDAQALAAMMLAAAKASGAKIIGEHHHCFEPYGISCIIILAESHLSLHTWPEHHFAAADLFSCSQDIDASKAGEVLAAVLRPKAKECSEIRRGRRLKNLI